MGSLRSFAVAVTALAVLVPARAGADFSSTPNGVATAVVVRTLGRIGGGDEWFSFQSDGTAYRHGSVDARYGQYQAKIDFAAVARIVTDAQLCSGPSMVLQPADATFPDAVHYSADVRCGGRWRYVQPGGADRARVDKAIAALRTIADAVSWEQSWPQPPPDGGIREAAPAQR